MSTKRSTITQTLVNGFPEWSDIRQDEQSLGGQFINVVGNRLQDLYEQLQHLKSNQYLTTANTNEMDIVYKFELPKDYEFSVKDDDDSNRQFVVPTVSGLVSTEWYPLTIASGNNIETFWYTTIPNRITCSGYVITNLLNDDLNQKILGGLMQDYEYKSPLYPLTSGIYLDTPNRIWVEVMSGVQFIDIDEDKQATRGIVTLTGITRKGTTESETLVFIHNDIQSTSKEWSKLTQVDVQNIKNADTTKVRLMAHRFGREHSPQIPPPQDNYNLLTSAGSKQPNTMFWDVSTTSPKLTLSVYAMDDIRDRISGLLDKSIIRSWQLLKPDGTNTIGTPIDLAVEPFSHRIWVIDNANTLYLFDDDITLPNMSTLVNKNFDAMAVIEPSSYHIISGESVTLNYFWRRPIKDMSRHRVYVKAPDGTRYSVANGSLVAIDLAGHWVYGSPTGRYLRDPTTHTLTQRGDWLWTMDVVYDDGTQETDQRIVTVDYKIAKVQFSLSNCLDSNYNVKGIDFDADQVMWIAAYNASDVKYKKYAVKTHTDVMMIDFERKTIFLKALYDQVKVVK